MRQSTIGTFLQPWIQLPKVGAYFVAIWLVGAAVLTGLHVRFPTDQAKKREFIPLEISSPLEVKINGDRVVSKRISQGIVDSQKK